jgi:hypothetical protein
MQGLNFAKLNSEASIASAISARALVRTS